MIGDEVWTLIVFCIGDATDIGEFAEANVPG